MADYSVAVLLITDGRPCLSDTLTYASKHLFSAVDQFVVVNDARHELGLTGAVFHGWEEIADRCKPDDVVFHLEDDFVLPHHVNLPGMVSLLDRKELAQVALKRQPVNPDEESAGDLFRAYPERYIDRGDWVESNFGFTFNPCVYKVSTVVRLLARRHLWRNLAGESGVTAMLRDDNPEVRFGMYGKYDDPPRCFHIGHQRAEGWKL